MEKLTEYQLNFEKGPGFNREVYLEYFNVDSAQIEDFQILEDNDTELMVQFYSKEEQFDEIRMSIEEELDLNFGVIDFYVDCFDDSDILEQESSVED